MVRNQFIPFHKITGEISHPFPFYTNYTFCTLRILKPVQLYRKVKVNSPPAKTNLAINQTQDLKSLLQSEVWNIVPG